MLELKKIYKEYIMGDFKQVALDKVNLNFRKNEFVSILGPSGSGKTTLLNIIGGLDNYTSKLTEYVIDSIKKSSIVHEQENNKEVNIFTGSTFKLDEGYEDNLRKLGVTSVDNPSSISIYSKDFEAKENVVRIIDEYNKEALEEKNYLY